MSDKIRIGIEGYRAQVMDYIRTNNRPVMVSANSLWRSNKFSDSWVKYKGLDVALDSGGFVAMKMFGGYRFSVEQYVELARAMNPTWWAQMDFCCEPEIAANSGEVSKRIDKTAEYLGACQDTASRVGAAQPVIVLQGWKPEDYTSGPAFDNPDFKWPELVAVGSVCRRNLYGATGLLAVIGRLDAKLPQHVKLHLFGVKGAAIAKLKDHPRFYSMDSQAWARAARWEASHSGNPCDGNMRARNVKRWDEQQRWQLVDAVPTLL